MEEVSAWSNEHSIYILWVGGKDATGSDMIQWIHGERDISTQFWHGAVGEPQHHNGDCVYLNTAVSRIAISACCCYYLCETMYALCQLVM